MTESESVALPLGDTPNIKNTGAATVFLRKWLGWMDSNHRNDGVKVRCLTTWLQPNIKKENGVDSESRTHATSNLAL